MDIKSNKKEFIANVLGIFEDFLNEKNLVVNNPEKLYVNNSSNIFGTDYAYLEMKIEDLLSKK